MALALSSNALACGLEGQESLANPALMLARIIHNPTRQLTLRVVNFCALCALLWLNPNRLFLNHEIRE